MCIPRVYPTFSCFSCLVRLVRLRFKVKHSKAIPVKLSWGQPLVLPLCGLASLEGSAVLCKARSCCMTFSDLFRPFDAHVCFQRTWPFTSFTLFTFSWRSIVLEDLWKKLQAALAKAASFRHLALPLCQGGIMAPKNLVCDFHTPVASLSFWQEPALALPMLPPLQAAADILQSLRHQHLTDSTEPTLHQHIKKEA